MNRFERRLILAAVLFVALYLGAAGLTIHHRMTAERKDAPRLESAEPLREERHLMMAELLLPMLILLTVSLSYVLVKKKREKTVRRMEEEAEDDFEGEWRAAGTDPIVRDREERVP